MRSKKCDCQIRNLASHMPQCGSTGSLAPIGGAHQFAGQTRQAESKPLTFEDMATFVESILKDAGKAPARIEVSLQDKIRQQSADIDILSARIQTLQKELELRTLTRREQIAAMALQGLLANSEHRRAIMKAIDDKRVSSDQAVKLDAEDAVYFADALLAELKK